MVKFIMEQIMLSMSRNKLLRLFSPSLGEDSAKKHVQRGEDRYAKKSIY